MTAQICCPAVKVHCDVTILSCCSWRHINNSCWNNYKKIIVILKFQFRFYIFEDHQGCIWPDKILRPWAHSFSKSAPEIFSVRPLIYIKSKSNFNFHIQGNKSPVKIYPLFCPLILPWRRIDNGIERSGTGI